MGSKYAANTNHAFLRLPDTTLGVYNLHDAYQTAKLVAPLLRELKSRGNLEYAIGTMESLQRAVINMGKRGILCDRGRLQDYRRQVQQELRATDRTILDRPDADALLAPTGKSPNGIGSPKRLGRYLFDTLGLKPPKKTDTGLDSTDQESLGRILKGLRKKDEHARVVLEALFHRSRLKTISQRYLGFDIDPDSRVRARCKMFGPKTFRFAYENPPLQQYPKEARHVFVAAPGKVLLQVDYSQLEARILAYLSGDEPSTEVFRTGGDVHVQNAKDLFGYGEDTWLGLGSLVQDKTRFFSKGFLYGISYGGEAETMKTKEFCPCSKCADSVPPTLRLKKSEIAAAADRWHHKHPRVREWQEENAAFVRKHHYYESPMGCRRWIARPWGNDLDRELKNIPMQFGGALLMNDRQVTLDQAGAPIIFQMHDSFLLEIPKEELDYWAGLTKETMEAPVPGLGGVSIPVDVECGESWGEMERWSP